MNLAQRLRRLKGKKVTVSFPGLRERSGKLKEIGSDYIVVDAILPNEQNRIIKAVIPFTAIEDINITKY
ncbi:MAG: hypothetical protein AAB484_01860 [Patescibacteria group bacterium]